MRLDRRGGTTYDLATSYLGDLGQATISLNASFSSSVKWK